MLLCSWAFNLGDACCCAVGLLVGRMHVGAGHVVLSLLSLLETCDVPTRIYAPDIRVHTTNRLSIYR